MRKIAVVTGTRAEYGILKPVLYALPRENLRLVVTGTHLDPKFGFTYKEITKDGFKANSKVPMFSDGTLKGMASTIGQGIIGMTMVWEKIRPDIILVLGDRIEPLAAAISGAYMNIPIAHIHGGEITGNIDNSARHAITKFAHIHFPATQTSAERIERMGEEKWRIHTVGSPAIDEILRIPTLSLGYLKDKYKIDPSKPLVLVVQHPVTSQVKEAAEQIKITLQAVKGYQTILIYPNSDAGSRAIIRRIKNLKVYKNLPRQEYLGLLKASSVLVGNSSSGIIDAPSLGVPVVNIGIRQSGRERGENVVNATHYKEVIQRAIEHCLTDKHFLEKVKKCESPYGDGKSGKRISDILMGVELSPRLLQKRFIDAI